jgi:hypothetical protein
MSRSATRKRFQAGAAGAGGGTVFLLLAKNLPETNPWKSWLVIIAPTLAVALSGIYAWCLHQATEWINGWQFERYFQRAEQTLINALQDPNISEQRRKRLSSELEEIRLLRIKKTLEPLKLLADE